MAHASEQDVARDNTVPVEEIVVTGQRAADQAAIAIKRRESRIVDAVAADDVGKIEDFNAGEAIRRIAGTNVWSYLGEPRFVTIRGFNTSYNTTTVDGFQLASPDNANYGSGRQFYMDALPSNVASRIEVFKTNSAEMDGHSLGGTVNFVVPDALDQRKDRTAVNVRGGANVTKRRYGSDRPTQAGDFTLMRAFGEDKQFGVSLIGSYWQREMNLAATEIGGDAYSFGPAQKLGGLAAVLNPYAGAFGPYPAQNLQYNYDDTRWRRSLVSKLSWRPRDGMQLAVDALYLDQREHFLRNEATLDPAQSGSNFFGRNLGPDSAEINNVASLHQLLDARFKREISGLNATWSYDFRDRWRAEIKAGYSEAKFTNPQGFYRFALPAARDQFYSLQRHGAHWTWTPVGAAFGAIHSNFANYTTSNGGGQSGASGGRNLTEQFYTRAKLPEAQVRLDYNMDASDRGAGFSAGIKYESNERTDDYTRTDYGTSTQGISLAQVFTGKYLGSVGCSRRDCIPLIDPDTVWELASQLPSSFNQAAFGNKFSTEEQISSGFAMARWRAGRWEAQVGVRAEYTDYFTSGFENVSGGAGPQGYRPVAATDRFTDILPSLSLVYDTATNMRTRFAFSETIGRPSLTQKSLRGGAVNFSQEPATRTRGNPDLQPLSSKNFDVIHEWYFDRGQGMLTAGAFYKRIDDHIYIVRASILLDGVEVLNTMPVNSPYTATVYGAEMSFIKNFYFLPGVLANFGFQSNGFVLNTRFPIQLQDGRRFDLGSLPDQAEYGINTALFYEDRHGFSARLAWNRTGETWDGRVGGATNLPGADNPSVDGLYRLLFNTAVDSLDFKMAYQFRRGLKVSLSGTNLLHEGTSANIGNDQEIVARRQYVPTTFLIGLSVDL